MTTGSYYALLFTLAQYPQTGLADSALSDGHGPGNARRAADLAQVSGVRHAVRAAPERANLLAVPGMWRPHG